MHMRPCLKSIAAAQCRLKPGDFQVLMTVIREATVGSLTNVSKFSAGCLGYHLALRLSTLLAVANDTRKPEVWMLG